MRTRGSFYEVTTTAVLGAFVEAGKAVERRSALMTNPQNAGEPDIQMAGPGLVAGLGRLEIGSRLVSNYAREKSGVGNALSRVLLAPREQQAVWRP